MSTLLWVQLLLTSWHTVSAADPEHVWTDHELVYAAVNFADQSKLYQHHEVPKQMLRRPLAVEQYYVTEFTGLRVPRNYDCRSPSRPLLTFGERGDGALGAYSYYKVSSRWFPCNRLEYLVNVGQKLFIPDYPVVDDEYMEAARIYQAVLDAAGEFTLAELGARWGTWGFRAAAAARAYNPTIEKVNLFFMEPDADSCFAIEEMAELNNFQPPWASITVVCDYANAPHFREWAYTVSMIDILEVDIQGAELKMLQSIFHVVEAKVKVLMVGTHSKLLHEEILQLFAHWKVVANEAFVCSRCLDLARGDDHWNDQTKLQHPSCLPQAQNSSFGPIFNCDGEIVLRNPSFS